MRPFQLRESKQDLHVKGPDCLHEKTTCMKLWTPSKPKNGQFSKKPIDFWANSNIHQRGNKWLKAHWVVGHLDWPIRSWRGSWKAAAKIGLNISAKVVDMLTQSFRFLKSLGYIAILRWRNPKTKLAEAFLLLALPIRIFEHWFVAVFLSPQVEVWRWDCAGLHWHQAHCVRLVWGLANL